MSYKIAVASSDGTQIDETFGAAGSFIIYEVTDGEYAKLEERVFEPEEDDTASGGITATACGDSNASGSGCGNGGCGAVNVCGSSNASGTGCGTGGCGNGMGGGCGGAGEASAKVELISDCRCVVCKKIGFNIQKQLERKAISAFDVSCSVEEALNKIALYYKRMDNHESLRAQ